ncbi:cation:proton antiporter [Rhodotorula paludigena]|uniref:cation:proton antiporter n=1 Tax=Rhodotorula paludigena TaxID=86838 RepID=UPI0031754ABC
MSSPSSSIAAPGTIPYHEPGFVDLAIVVSFLYFVQVARAIANRLLHAGLLGEIAVGVVYGPVARILHTDWQQTFLVVGYIGLVLIVFEGGLTLQPKSFLPQLPMAVIVALCGILLPLAFTFALFSAPTFGYPPLQAFTTGSALASTSLGTTFFVLRSAGPELSTTAVGEILKGAALIDDVIALVLLSVIQSVASGGGNLGWTIGRPVVASVGMAVVTPLVTRWLFQPLFRVGKVERLVQRGGRAVELFLGVAVLCAFLSIAYFAGTTMLLGAFLAGAFLSALPSPGSNISFVRCWEEWLVPLQEHIFVPIFFASIGFSIPFHDLWAGARIWRGIAYSLLMALGKVLAGGPILSLDLVARPAPHTTDSLQLTEEQRGEESGRSSAQETAIELTGCIDAEKGRASRLRSATRVQIERGGRSPFVRESLPCAAFVGLALVARGEIGILILQVAYTTSTASSSASSSSSSSGSTLVLTEEPYLIGIWAVALCTIAGPVAFGALVRRCEGVVKASARWG